MLNAKASPSECQLAECVYRAPDCSLPLAELHSLRLTFSLRLSCHCFSFQISDFFLYGMLPILCAWNSVSSPVFLCQTKSSQNKCDTQSYPTQPKQNNKILNIFLCSHHLPKHITFYAAKR